MTQVTESERYLWVLAELERIAKHKRVRRKSPRKWTGFRNRK